MHRFVCDLISTEVARLRPGRTPPPLPWALNARFEDDLGIDSFERLRLATALSEAVHLHAGGIDDTLLTDQTLARWVATVAASLDRDSKNMTFRTSGSTGRPKWCVHELAELEAEIDYLTSLFSGCRRIVSAVPSHHIYGFLFTILLPVRLSARVIDVRPHAPSYLAGLLEAGDVIIGHPEFWRAFARTVPHVHSGVTGVTSTAPCPADIAKAVTANGVARLVQVYGSSETAGIGWRDDPDAAYELFSYWSHAGSDAELVRTLVNRSKRVVSLPDRLLWDDDRHVRPAGRIEGAVQVGSTNVFPQRVSTILCTHPDVAEAAVRLMRPDEGERLKAFIVPRDTTVNVQKLETDLWAFIDAQLSVPERPKSLTFGPELPTSALGKKSDWAIR